jgi:hypothetical protein
MHPGRSSPANRQASQRGGKLKVPEGEGIQEDGSGFSTGISGKSFLVSYPPPNKADNFEIIDRSVFISSEQKPEKLHMLQYP